jgi:hypothetical protein
MDDKGTVFSQRDFWVLRKLRETSSPSAWATDFWSRGAAPPFGEAMVISVWGERMA